jgi:hypothetical protein
MKPKLAPTERAKGTCPSLSIFHDISIECDSPDALFTALAMERDQFHRKSEPL